MAFNPTPPPGSDPETTKLVLDAYAGAARSLEGIKFFVSAAQRFEGELEATQQAEFLEQALRLDDALKASSRAIEDAKSLHSQEYVTCGPWGDPSWHALVRGIGFAAMDGIRAGIKASLAKAGGKNGKWLHEVSITPDVWQPGTWAAVRKRLLKLRVPDLDTLTHNVEQECQSALGRLPKAGFGPSAPRVLVVALESFVGKDSCAAGRFYALPRDRADKLIKSRYVLPVHPANAALPPDLAAMVEHGLVVAHPDAPPPKTRPAPAAKAPASSTAAAGAVRSKRSTSRGDGRAKLIAALTIHHQYADGGCLNLEPIGNNELARLAGVAKRTASAFFDNEFQGHGKYKAACSDAGRLAAALKLLNGEFAPHLLYGTKPPEEADE